MYGHWEKPVFFDFEKYTYYVAPGGTDMRKGADSLARLIWQNMALDAHSRNMFLFCSKNKRTLAVLVWDNGFWLMKKKLYSGTFAWPGDSTQALTITVEDVRRVIRGDDVFRRIPLLPDGAKI